MGLGEVKGKGLVDSLRLEDGVQLVYIVILRGRSRRSPDGVSRPQFFFIVLQRGRGGKRSDLS